ncbi:MAG: DNA polymerase sliding clamp, partial [Halobacteriaceae archaeon]
GLDLARLSDIVNTYSPGTVLRLSLDPEAQRLNISAEGLRFRIALLASDSIREPPDLPDIDFPTRFVLEGHPLTRALDGAATVSDQIKFTVCTESEELQIKARGDTDAIFVRFGVEDVISGDFGTGVSASFSLDFLENIASPIAPDRHVVLELNDGQPAKISYEFGDGTGAVTHMVAPRIDSSG